MLDLVTLHTGTAQHDFNETPIEVASIKYFHDEAGNWFAETELGAQYIHPSVESFQAQVTSAIRNAPPNPRLCSPTIPPGAPGGGTELLNEAWDYTTDNESTPGNYTWSERDTNPDGHGLDASAPVGTASSVYRYSARMPCSAGSTLRLTGSIIRAVGGGGGASFGSKEHRVYWYATLGAVNEFDSDILGSVSCSGSTAAAFDYSIVVPVGATYFRLRQDRISHQDNVTVTVTDDDVTPGTPGSPGGGLEELTGTSTFAARCGHKHHVLRTTSPQATDDLEHGFPAGTAWMLVDDVDNPTTVFAIWRSIDDTNGAAVWFQEYPETTGATSGVVVDHGAMGADEEFDFTDGSDHEGILDEALTVTLTGATDGEAAWLTLALTDDGSGPYTLTWPAEVVWPGGVEPDPPAAGEALIVSLFSYDGGTNWYGAFPGAGGGSASGRWELVVSGTAPPVAVTNEAEDDFLYALVED